MTLTFKLDLDILPLDLHTKIQVRMFVRSPVRARHTHTDRAKTITPIADAGCKKTLCSTSYIYGWAETETYSDCK